MFIWFKPRCPLDDSAKLWVERRMAWLTHEFGWEHILTAPVVLPNDEYFPDPYDESLDAAERLADRMCHYLGVDRTRVRLKFYSGRRAPFVGLNASGLYEELEGRSDVWLEVSHLADPASVAGTIAHELAHVLLLGGGRMAPDIEDMEPLTDLYTVFSGAGVLTANTAFRDRSYHVANWEAWSISTQGYLTSEMFGYALALFAWVRGESKPRWAKFLSVNVRTPFHKGLDYLIRTGDSTYVRDGDLRPDWLCPCPLVVRTQHDIHATSEDEGKEPSGDHDIEARGQTADDLFTEGTILAGEGDFSGAVRQYTEAIRRCPDDAESYQQRSLAYSQLGKCQEAMADGEKAIHLAPEDLESYRARGCAYFGCGFYERAADDFSRIVKEEKSDVEANNRRWNAYYWRGRVFAAQGDLARALADLRKAVIFGPQQAEVFVERSRLYDQLSEREKAIADRSEAFRLDPMLAEQEFGFRGNENS